MIKLFLPFVITGCCCFEIQLEKVSQPRTATQQNTLVNKTNYYYVGTLFLGVHKEHVPVIWDTGSGWMLVQGSECGDTCSMNYFDETASSTFIPQGTPTNFKFLSANVQAYQAQDYVCIHRTNICITTSISVITTQEGMPKSIAGIIGLGLTEDNYFQ
jgi:hypothetical protein